MSTRQLASALVVAAAFAVPVVARAETKSDPPQCFLEDSRVVSVKPYYGKLEQGKDLPPLLGAKVELVPSGMLTAVQLEERIRELLGAHARAPLPVCLIDVGHVHIESGDLGEAAAVTLIAKDPKDAEQVFHRAQLLVE